MSTVGPNSMSLPERKKPVYCDTHPACCMLCITITIVYPLASSVINPQFSMRRLFLPHLWTGMIHSKQDRSPHWKGEARVHHVGAVRTHRYRPYIISTYLQSVPAV